MLTIDTRDGMTGGIAAPPASLASLRRLLTPERILLAMTDARSVFATLALPQGVTPKRSGYSDVLWAEPTSIDRLTSLAAAHYASGDPEPFEADTLPLKSVHWTHVWRTRTADGVSLEYRLTVRMAPRYQDGIRPDAGHLYLGGEISQMPELPAGLTADALAPRYRPASLTFTATPKA